MAKKPSPSLNSYQRKLQNGYGTGIGQYYKPWIAESELPDHGVTSKPFGLKTNRIHLCLSNHESNFLYIAEFDSEVVDIREQFPLFPLELSMRASEELGIKYPINPKTQLPIIITTDFLLTCNSGNGYYYEAYSVKPEDGLRTTRDFEKQEIERAWWESLGIKWQIYIDTEVQKVVAENIKWISQPARNNVVFRAEVLTKALDLIEIGKSDISIIVRRLVKELNLGELEASSLFKTLIWEKFIEVDLTVQIEKYGIVNILKTLALTGQEELFYGLGA